MKFFVDPRLKARRASRRGQGSERGQVLALVTLAMVGMLAMVALIIDGGNAWAQQRITQNGTDAAAEAGATVLAQRVGENPSTNQPDAWWDAQVAARVSLMAATNGIGVTAAYYTDICGQMLQLDGSAALDTTAAALVGAGALPLGTGPTPPSCNSNPPVGPVAGVRVFGTHPFPTYLASIVGITSFTANTNAVAVEGFLQGACDPSTLTGCALIPMALPPWLTYCDGNGKSSYSTPPTDYPLNEPVVIPICKNGPGNFGWVDWNPNDKYNGSSGLVACTQTPCNEGFTLKAWLNVAQSGNPHSGPLEDALNGHDGEVLLVPIFDSICAGNPDLAQANGTPPYGCPDSPPYDLQGGMNGSSNWYHVFEMAAFQLQHAYTNGSNTAECNPPWSPSGGSDNCLIGTFTTLVTTGTVGANSGPRSGPGLQAVGVQLIK